MKIHLHIGLPKTATTSLQSSVFPMHKADVHYCGKYVEHSRNYVLYEILTSFVHGGLRLTEARKRFALECTKLEAEGIKSILVSDEMFVVDTRESSWQTKLRRCSELFATTNCLVIVGIRDPIDALFSMYVELGGSGRRGLTFEGFVARSNQAKIYRYEQLNKYLVENFQWAKINYVPYERYLNTIVGLEADHLFGLKFDAGITMAATNEKKRTEAGVYTGGESLLTKAAKSKSLYTVSRVVPNRFRRSLKIYIDRRLRSREEFVPAPCASVVEELRDSLACDIEFYNRYRRLVCG